MCEFWGVQGAHPWQAVGVGNWEILLAKDIYPDIACCEMRDCRQEEFRADCWSTLCHFQSFSRHFQLLFVVFKMSRFVVLRLIED